MRVKREPVEWVHFLSAETERHDLPRVFLIGDSITEGYYRAVAERLQGTCIVDFLALAYSVDMPIYHRLVMTFVRENRYDVIHFNHGLHCGHMTDIDLYRTKLEELLLKIGTERTIIANSTIAYEPNGMEPHRIWKRQLPLLNAEVDTIAKDLSIPLNDLYTVSAGIGPEGLSGDGLHFSGLGYGIIADKVADEIRRFISERK